MAYQGFASSSPSIKPYLSPQKHRLVWSGLKENFICSLQQKK